MTTTTAPTIESPRFVVAVPEPPAIACPSWCTFTQEEHAAELASWEGFVIHMGDDVGPAPQYRLSSNTYVDGTPSPDEPDIQVRFGGTADNGLTLDGAETFALALLASIKAARS